MAKRITAERLTEILSDEITPILPEQGFRTERITIKPNPVCVDCPEPRCPGNAKATDSCRRRKLFEQDR